MPRNASSLLGDRPSNDYGDIVAPPAIERVLEKLLANLARRFHRPQSLGDPLI